MDKPSAILIELPEGFRAAAKTLALGGELKSTVCLLDHGKAVISQAIGDLEQESVYRHFSEQVDAVFEDDSPEHLVIDKHPDYLSSQLGKRLAEEHGIRITSVQHHHAHIASVMADNGLPLNSKPVLGLALDGLGFGEDGMIWGGEALLGAYHGFQRLACFQPVAMIGGAAAIHEPWRNTMAHLLPIWDQVNSEFADSDIVQFLNTKPVAMLQTMVGKGLNAPLASSCGRLFDAVAACLGLYREQVSFEAQAAIALEKLATTCFEQESRPYAFVIQSDKDGRDCMQLNWQPMWLELLGDIQNDVEPATIASRFHHTLIHALGDLVAGLKKQHDFDTVALSGGVFQNRLLSIHLPRLLESRGFTVLQHREVPTHDGGLALGQAMIAAARFNKSTNSKAGALRNTI
jgi:hydrogenase maturation protein HypF